MKCDTCRGKRAAKFIEGTQVKVCKPCYEAIGWAVAFDKDFGTYQANIAAEAIRRAGRA